PRATRVARQLRDRFPTVGDRWTPQLGVKTGADDVFLVAAAAPWTRPAVRGRDLRAWRATPHAHLLWTHAADGRPIARLPRDPARGGFHRFNARVVRGLPIPPAESPAWRTLAAAGSSGVADDAAIADLYHLDASDRRVLAPLAPRAAGAADSV